MITPFSTPQHVLQMSTVIFAAPGADVMNKLSIAEIMTSGWSKIHPIRAHFFSNSIYFLHLNLFMTLDPAKRPQQKTFGLLAARNFSISAAVRRMNTWCVNQDWAIRHQ